MDSLALISDGMFAKNFKASASANIFNQLSLVIQPKGFLFAVLMSRAAPPLKKSVTSPPFKRPAVTSIFSVQIRMNVSLSFS